MNYNEYVIWIREKDREKCCLKGTVNRTVYVVTKFALNTTFSPFVDGSSTSDSLSIFLFYCFRLDS
jgi:hypothetical protein